MSKKRDDRWIIAVDPTRRQLIKSIALFTEISMSELIEKSIEDFLQKIQTGDYRLNLEEMKRTKKESIKLKRMLAELEEIKIEYADTMQDLGIKELTGEKT